jgi:hypothetical protein
MQKISKDLLFLIAMLACFYSIQACETSAQAPISSSTPSITPTHEPSPQSIPSSSPMASPPKSEPNVPLCGVATWGGQIVTGSIDFGPCEGQSSK